ncbi:Pep3/Vps18/deep orange family-domain-containing protein [Russula earlei]|uniref:Pep3/Vps18/deep orange family-domain-containing protein n=2 Tax=Russula earlei TaxID=71964 RepID=A0ACC0U2A7_9AGAM|nr:Pep3/Vps18/deep orange family-domain-containing protein [Russula earlei]KAI9457720.1 Pep3/Vps18/deep orange family-domain-containing protein [Russula earlei]
MFDDYVEHAATAASRVTHGTGVPPPRRYEGFEPSPYGHENARESELEASDNRHTGPPNALAPIFDLGRVQYTLAAPLVSLVVASDVLAMGLSSNVIVLIELAHTDQVFKIPIPRKPTEFTIYKLFMDPSGRHLVITSLEGENWYLFRNWKKPKQLKTFKMVIESIAWNKAALLSSSHLTSTREILIGARNGTIYEAVLDAEEDFFKSQERYLSAVFALPERQPITGINFDFFPSIDPKKALIVAITTSRIYQFTGPLPRRPDEGGRVFGMIFSAYRETAPKISELPGSIRHSELHYYTPNSGQSHSLPNEIAWMTSPGIYHGTLNFQSTSDDFIDGAQLFPYPVLPLPPDPSCEQSQPEFPVSMALTEFHLVLLYSDRIAAISTLNESLVHEELLPLKHGEAARALTADPVRKTYWVHTDQSLFELRVGNEDRDVWKINLQKENFDVAIRYAKTAEQRDIIFATHAHALLKAKRYFPAARAFAQCSMPFEDVTLKFLDVNERDALRSYLILRLEQIRKSDLTQRMILATWLVEFYLSKCDELDDLIASSSALYDVENVKTERLILEEDLRRFLESHKNDFDPNTIYELIQSHGRTDVYLFYATSIGQFERVVEHWILEEDWVKAIDAISRQSNLEVYYQYGPVLMRNAPRETVDSWIRQPALDPLRFVPALLQFQLVPRDPLSPNQATRYLNHVIFEQQNTSSTLHNLVITLHASPTAGSPEDDGPLLRFLATAPVDPLTGKPYYDLDYALRLCSETGRIQPCVHIYSQMGLWESSVDLALEKGDLELAKLNADKPEDDPQLRKKLWLKIAKFVVQDKKDIKMAMRFLENTDVLKIEDILPFFPDFVVIDDFKDEIANALESYSAQIESLKNEMDDATRSAESMKEYIVGLKNRFITIDAGERCSVCSIPILTRQFYVFPCHHAFHADCLVGLTKEYMPAHALRRLLSLQDEIVKGKGGSIDQSDLTPIDGNTASWQPGSQRTLLSQNLATQTQNGSRQANTIGRNLLSAGDRLRDLIIPDALVTVITSPAGWIPGIGSAQKSALVEAGAGKRLEKLRSKLEDILASACPLCESVIVGLDKPFTNGEQDSTWEV